MNSNDQVVLNNIIGLNPTGIINFEGTYQMNGLNNIIRDSNGMSKDDLYKTQNNQIICNSIENFENYNNYNNKKKNYFELFLFILFIIFNIKKYIYI